MSSLEALHGNEESPKIGVTYYREKALFGHLLEIEIELGGRFQAKVKCSKCGMHGTVIGLLPEFLEDLQNHLPITIPSCSQYKMFRALR